MDKYVVSENKIELGEVNISKENSNEMILFSKSNKGEDSDE